ncbi:MAG TPA: PD-(D/E)XK nuclease family protein [Acidobacteriaceae bacterium]|jgi:probable DNA repair protein|nr:PD-(D/E)XK nuclease family protein [Acidobacteriaceae bacterium]
MSAPLTEPELLDALARGVRVVLPNPRAARTLRRAFDDRQRATGVAAWEPAPALSWSDWTRSLWSGLVAAGLELRLLLNSAQEHILWREVITSSTTRSLTSPDSLAELARSAFHLAAAHNAVARLRSTATTSDNRTFAAWAESFTRLCAGQNCLPAAQLEDALRTHALAGSLSLDSPILLAGFSNPANPEDLTPAQSALLEALRSTNASRSANGPIEIAELTVPADPTAVRAHTIAPTPREELQLAAHWLRRFLEKHTTTTHTPRIAVLLPQPEPDRAELDSIFREILAPELEPITADLSAAPWEFVAGSPLASQPMTTAALDLLRWTRSPLPLERVSALLRSPFFGSAATRLAAARFDAHLLRRNLSLVPELTLDAVRRLSAQQARSNDSFLSPIPWLQPIADLLARPQTSTRTFADWAEHFRSILRAAGWPANSASSREPTASEFETSRAWDSTLDLLSTLDFRGRRVPFAEALQPLERLVQTARVSSPFAHAPIQIMSPSEAEGSVFDAVLLLHATDDSWPEPQHLHPLLGWPLQREFDLPGADAALDATRARTRAESLLARSTHILITGAQTNADGELRPSPLLRHLNLTPTQPSALITLPPPTSPLTEDLIPDTTPLPPLPSPTLRGGATVLKQQAACGFLAFAELRLNATSPEPTALGLDPSDRGNLVHRALEDFWKNTHSQAELRSLTAEERNRRLDHAIDFAFTKVAPAAELWSAAYIALQRERLRDLLSRWLDFELQRAPFTVLSNETKQDFDIGPLHLSLRPDRIDQVEGGLALVDYKTGASAKPANWLGDRPDDPQLPLYALRTEPHQLKGLFFARLRPGKEMGWLGLASDASALSALKPRDYADLDARIDEWRTVLTTLAHNFASGRADVSPKSYAVNCRRCGQRLLCRLDPSSLLTTDEDDPDESNENPEDADG